MNRTKFTLENLKQLDFGLIGTAFNAELTRVVKDLQERPMDDGARKINIAFNMVPVPDVNTNTGSIDLDEVKVECEITSAVPKHRTKIYTMKPMQDGSLSFHPDMADEPDGSLLTDDDVIERERKSGKQD